MLFTSSTHYFLTKEINDYGALQKTLHQTKGIEYNVKVKIKEQAYTPANKRKNHVNIGFFCIINIHLHKQHCGY